MIGAHGRPKLDQCQLHLPGLEIPSSRGYLITQHLPISLTKFVQLYELPSRSEEHTSELQSH